MEANPGGLCSSSGSEGSLHTPEEECVQNVEKEQEEKVISAMADAEHIWNTASEKQLFISRLRGEQIKVSETFSRFYEISRFMEQSISENIESYHRFTELSEQVEPLDHILNEFELKLRTSEKIVHDFIGAIKAHLSALKQSIDSARESGNLGSLQLPSMQWVETVPDPEVETLVDEWELMQLDLRMTEYLRQLEELVDPSGIDMEAQPVEDFE